MPLGTNRRRIFVRGLGSFAVREVDPNSASEFANVGFHRDVSVLIEPEMVDIVDAAGRYVDTKPSAIKHSATVSLMQTSLDEIDLLRNSVGKQYAARYYGTTGGGQFQYWLWPLVRISPGVSLTFRAGERLLPLNMLALRDTSVAFDVPEVVVAEAAGEMVLDNMRLWLSPRLKLNRNTDRVLDVSGYQRHCQLSADYTSIWSGVTLDPAWLLFDGLNDTATLGNTLNMTTNEAMLIELWVKITGTDSEIHEIVFKHSSQGYSIVRDDSNKILFRVIGTGGNFVLNDPGIFQNDVVYIAALYNPGSEHRLYVNVSSVSSDTADVGNPSNSAELRLASNSQAASFGNVAIGDVRFHTFTAPVDTSLIDTIVAKHFAAERGYYGI